MDLLSFPSMNMRRTLQKFEGNVEKRHPFFVVTTAVDRLARIKRRLIAVIAAALTLSLSQPGVASENLCDNLFASTITSQTLNEASQEYLLRLRYLLLDRRILGPQVLDTLLASSSPLNPFGDRARNLSMQPHHAAFADLLKEDLQWPVIQADIRSLIQSAQEEKNREQAAVKKTETALLPLAIKFFPYPIHKVVRTGQGRVLGVSISDFSSSRKADLTTIDLPSGTVVSSTSIPGYAQTRSIDSRPYGETALVTFGELLSDLLITVDLVHGRVLSSPEVDPEGTLHAQLEGRKPTYPTAPHFINLKTNIGLGVAILRDNHAFLLDPFSGKFAPQVEINKQSDYDATSTGTVGYLVYSSGPKSGTYIIDPTGQTPTRSYDDLSTLSSFTHQNRTLAFGIDLKNDQKDQGERTLKVVDLASGQSFPSFKVISEKGQPTLIDHFAQDGTFYGLIATNADLYLVDLRAGVILRQLSKMNPELKLDLHWLTSTSVQAGFDYQGRRYALVKTEGKDVNDLGAFVDLDLRTFKQTNSGLTLPDRPLNFHLLPSDGENIHAVVNFRDGTSRLFSLVSTFNEQQSKGGPR